METVGVVVVLPEVFPDVFPVVLPDVLPVPVFSAAPLPPPPPEQAAKASRQKEDTRPTAFLDVSMTLPARFGVMEFPAPTSKPCGDRNQKMERRKSLPVPLTSKSQEYFHLCLQMI